MTEAEFLDMLREAERTFDAIRDSLTPERARKIELALGVFRTARDTGPEASRLLRQVVRVIEGYRCILCDGSFGARSVVDLDD